MKYVNVRKKEKLKHLSIKTAFNIQSLKSVFEIWLFSQIPKRNLNIVPLEFSKKHYE